MDKDTRNAIERATQRARKLLEEDFAAQLEGDFDVHRDGAVAAKAGGHLSARQAFQRERVVAAIEHKRAAGMSAADAARDYLRDAAFTALNRFVAFKMLEARDLVQECITKGEQSAGYREFCGMAPGLPLLPDSAGYRLYIESIFDELSTEVKVLFDRRDPSSVLWPKRATFERLLEILNATELARVWGEDETIGWVYQFFNGQDERRKMREESQAPRNSRELAVRNQFFTPRYVVQFLTDNTLGRIWYEMRGTETVLADKCEYMVRQPGEAFAPRAKKDPRDLRVLDPACGSGHFLLYAFDLLLAIYEEAYSDPESPKSEATGKTLAEDYPSVEALKKAVPGLVLVHNLHGVDIDPRCVQIAQLALWMRAQLAYRDFGVARADRRQIRRSNIVVAEPVVADERLAKEFAEKLGDLELARVFAALVDSLKVAGELGLLLRVEALVAPPAKRFESGNLFAPTEERIRSTLERFVVDEGRASTRRRLFADDATQGLGLLAIASLRFDAVLMNPPFGARSIGVDKLLKDQFPQTWQDLYGTFLQRGTELLAAEGMLGAITSRAALFLSSQEWLRRHVLTAGRTPFVVADLGIGVLDAMVETAAFCLRRGEHPMVFLRAVEIEKPDHGLLERIRRPSDHLHATPESLRAIPGMPFSYWISNRVREVFERVPKFERDGQTVKQGLATTDDFRFLRAWWEVSSSSTLEARWQPLAKGGSSQGFFGDVELVVDWLQDGRQLWAIYFAKRTGGIVKNPEYYFRPALTYTLRAARFRARALPSHSIISVRGSGIYAEPDRLLWFLGVMNSSAFDLLLKTLLGRDSHPQFDMGDINVTPVPECSEVQPDLRRRVEVLALDLWQLSHEGELTIEQRREFRLPELLMCPGESLEERYREAGRRGRDRENRQAALQGELEKICWSIYGLSESDFARSGATEGAEEPDTEESLESEATHSTSRNSFHAAVASLLSYCCGVCFGRFDPSPSRREPTEPTSGPFAAVVPPSPNSGELRPVLVDDEGHRDDLCAAVEFALDGIVGGAAGAVVGEACRALGTSSIREWLARDYSVIHQERYSSARRRAPIYWQLATPSASYSVWLYVHAFNKDTLFRVQNDYVAPRLAHEERRLESLTSELRDGATAAQRKQLAAQEALVEELRAFLDEVKRVAPLWKPNLDDGVIINFAPLWRLVPQNKSWQKELKSTWDALCEGKYDWADLAMHLWPERVVPNCARDRSLAIAHGLEEVFWVEGTDGKWTARKTPTGSVDELVRERTSPAVKSALKSLLEAPAAAGKSGGPRGGGRRKSAAAAEGGNV